MVAMVQIPQQTLYKQLQPIYEHLCFFTHFKFQFFYWTFVAMSESFQDGKYTPRNCKIGSAFITKEFCSSLRCYSCQDRKTSMFLGMMMFGSSKKANDILFIRPQANRVAIGYPPKDQESTRNGPNCILQRCWWLDNSNQYFSELLIELCSFVKNTVYFRVSVGQKF